MPVPSLMFLCFLLKNRPFWFRCMYLLIWGKFVLYKYVTCWLVTVSRKDKSFRQAGERGGWEAKSGKSPNRPSPQEGVCILSGLGFNGFEENGTAKWDACANMKVWLFETTPRFNGTIASFNINTNTWVAR